MEELSDLEMYGEEFEEGYTALGYTQIAFAAKMARDASHMVDGTSSSTLSRMARGNEKVPEDLVKWLLEQTPLRGYQERWAKFLRKRRRRLEAQRAQVPTIPGMKLFEVRPLEPVPNWMFRLFLGVPLELLTPGAGGPNAPPAAEQTPSSPAPGQQGAPPAGSVGLDRSRGGSRRRSSLQRLAQWAAVAALLLVASGYAERALGSAAPTRPIPDQPADDQKRPPCPGPPKGDEIEIKGGCYVLTGFKPPCPENEYEENGRCYTPKKVPPAVPRVNGESNPLPERPSLQKQ